MSKNKKNNNYKVIFVGNSAAGKSSIIHYCVNGVFNENINSTIGAIFHTIGYGRDEFTYEKKNTNTKLHIWDTSGQAMFRSIVNLYYRNTDVCVIVCDLTDDNSMESVDEWINEFKTKTNNVNARVIIVGNKYDLIMEHYQKEILNQMNKMGEKHNCPTIPVSALTGMNINKIFVMIYDLMENVTPHENMEKLKLDNDNNNEKNKNNQRKWWCNLL